MLPRDTDASGGPPTGLPSFDSVQQEMGHPELDALLKVFLSDVGEEAEEVEQKSYGAAPKGRHQFWQSPTRSRRMRSRSVPRRVRWSNSSS